MEGAEGSIISYLWSGPGEISNKQAAVTQVHGLFLGTHTIKLNITDNNGAAQIDKLVVRVILEKERPIVKTRLLSIGTFTEGFGRTVAASDDKVVFAGGFSSNICYTDFDLEELILCASDQVDIYDVNSSAWSAAKLSKARVYMGAISHENTLFFAGGSGPNSILEESEYFDQVDIYDAAINKWTQAHLSQPRSGVAAAAVGSKVLFAGGSTKDGISDRVDIYDLTTKQWSTATLSYPRSSINATTIGTKVYFAGGTGRLSEKYNYIDIYDYTTNSWSKSVLQHLEGPVNGMALKDNIYWAGVDKSGKVEIRNIKTGITTVHCLSVVPHSVFSKNDNIVYYGHVIQTEGYHYQLEIYNTSSDSWSIGPFDQNQAGTSIYSVHNTIYLVGGYYTGPRHQIWKVEF